jgi:hypothetical protein
MEGWALRFRMRIFADWNENDNLELPTDSQFP